MPTRHTTPANSVPATLLSVLLGLLPGCTGIDVLAQGDADAGYTLIHVSSVPSGAKVYVMGRVVGTTPLTISERDVYPVSYDAKQEPFYGSVQLKKTGCNDFRKRLTRSDIAGGLIVQLDCGEVVAAKTRPVAAPESKPVAQPTYSNSENGRAQKRLRQLKLLDELHEDGLITDEEEHTIRKRVLGSQ